MFKFFLKRRAEDSIQPTGDEPSIPRKGSAAVLRKNYHAPASNRNSLPLPSLPSSERSYQSAPASNGRVLRRSYHAASALNNPPPSGRNSPPLPPLPENDYYVVPPASNVPFAEGNYLPVPASNSEAQQDLRDNYPQAPASHPLPSSNLYNYPSVPASNRDSRPLPSSERNYNAVPASNNVPAPNRTAPRVLRKNYPSVSTLNHTSRPLPSSDLNYPSAPASNHDSRPLPSSARTHHAVPASNRNLRRVPVLSSELNYPTVPASNREDQQVPRENYPASASNHTSRPLPSSDLNYPSAPASNCPLPPSERNYRATSSRRPRRAPSSEQIYPSVPASNREDQQVPRENYPTASASNQTSRPLPSSGRNYPSVAPDDSSHPLPSSQRNYRAASSRRPRRVPSSERIYPSVPASNRENYPPVSASNQNSERNYRASSNRRARRVPSPERNYPVGPTSNSEDQQAPRGDYPVSASNQNPHPRPLPSPERNYRAASNRRARRDPSPERNYPVGPASNSEDQQAPRENYPPVSVSNVNPHPLPSQEHNYRSVPAPNRQARQALRNNYAVPVSNSNIQAPGFGTQSCNYCHRRPKFRHYDQCGRTCGNAAKIACLLCKSRPRYKLSPLCGSCSGLLPTMRAPLLLEAPLGHAMWNLVLRKLKNSWNYGTCPTIKRIYKLVGSKALLQRYEQYRQTLGKHTEVFCYHGTSRRCTLGSNGNTVLCRDAECALCSILKLSFKTSCADPNGAFGPGIYTSSAANKAYSYCANGQGALLVTKIVLGKVFPVKNFAAVNRCPPGYNSVVFNRQGGALNETVVYSDDAIRPVFLILFQ